MLALGILILVGIDGAEGEVLGSSLALGQDVEESGLAVGEGEGRTRGSGQQEAEDQQMTYPTLGKPTMPTFRLVPTLPSSSTFSSFTF